MQFVDHEYMGRATLRMAYGEMGMVGRKGGVIVLHHVGILLWPDQER